MMSMNWRKILSVTGIFLLGAIVGGLLCTFKILSIFTNDSARTNHTAIRQTVSTLINLREGRIENATEYLEIILDGNLVYFGVVGIRGSEKIRQDVISTLKIAKDYRRKYPRVTNYPEIDNSVAKAFAKISEKK